MLFCRCNVWKERFDASEPVVLHVAADLHFATAGIVEVANEVGTPVSASNNANFNHSSLEASSQRGIVLLLHAHSLWAVSINEAIG